MLIKLKSYKALYYLHLSPVGHSTFVLRFCFVMQKRLLQFSTPVVSVRRLTAHYSGWGFFCPLWYLAVCGGCLTKGVKYMRKEAQ